MFNGADGAQNARPSASLFLDRAIYELYDRVANLDMVQIDAPHNYNRQSREAVYKFFGK